MPAMQKCWRSHLPEKDGEQPMGDGLRDYGAVAQIDSRPSPAHTKDYHHQCEIGEVAEGEYGGRHQAGGRSPGDEGVTTARKERPQ